MTDESLNPPEPIDPPVNQGGGSGTTAEPEADVDEWKYGVPIDPPDNQGGGTGG
jgi:hypothetical protein